MKLVKDVVSSAKGIMRRIFRAIKLRDVSFTLPVHSGDVYKTQQLYGAVTNSFFALSVFLQKHLQITFKSPIFVADFADRYKDSVYFNAVTKKSIKESASGNRVHVVKRGETLGHIAMKYRVSVANLKRWNNLRSNNIRIGQRLRIYGGAAPAKSSTSSSSSSSSASTTKSGGYQWYTIKKNDTLSGIADKFPGVSLNDILKLNGFTTRTKIYPGKRIKIKKL
jgi:LysM repeat protein